MRVWNEGKYTVYSTGLVYKKGWPIFDNEMDQAIQDSKKVLLELKESGAPRYYINADNLKDIVTKRTERGYTPKGAVIIAALKLGLKIRHFNGMYGVEIKIAHKRVNLTEWHNKAR